MNTNTIDKIFGRVNINLLVFIGISIFVTLIFFTTPVTESNQGFDYDGRIYGVMAGEKSFEQELAYIAPWRYRVLTPFLASQLPLDVLDNFRVLAVGSNILSLFVLFLVLQQIGFSRGFAILGIFLYGGVFWTLKFSFYSPAYIDYLTQLILLLIIYLTLRRSFLLLIPVFILAALQKESLAAFSLFSAVYFLRERSARGWVASFAYILLLFAVSFGTLLLIRYLIDVDGLSSQTGAVLWEFRKLRDLETWLVLLQSIFSGLGFIPILLILHYRPWLELLRQRWEWIIYAVISLLFVFGGSDKGRLFLYFLPLAVILVLHSIRALKEFQPETRFRAWIIMFLLAHLYIGRYITPFGTFSQYLARMVPEHSDGEFKPYLITNLILGLALFVFTVQYMIGEWHFKFFAGFTKRNDLPVNTKN
ncbi:hypothetical protein [Candidatus Villigracilis affinis]|uniref:hypothetical protein n=1 Tax=Candidatus Villigracilis affinis TaxID=3140682 RepID=UPI002A195A19|nr:hypothetical protein [Anaerolineales bacterium]